MSIEAKIKQAKQRVSSLSTKHLCEVFEGMNGIRTSEIAMVRGWIMDELESRDAEKFNKWMDTEDVDAMNFPSRFF